MPDKRKTRFDSGHGLSGPKSWAFIDWSRKRKNRRHPVEVIKSRIDLAKYMGQVDPALFDEVRTEFDKLVDSDAFSPSGKRGGVASVETASAAEAVLDEFGTLTEQFERATYRAIFGDDEPSVEGMNAYLDSLLDIELSKTDPEANNRLRRLIKQHVEFICDRQGWQLHYVPDDKRKNPVPCFSVLVKAKRAVNNGLEVRPLKGGTPLWTKTALPHFCVSEK